jgi:hypothetical protein
MDDSVQVAEQVAKQRSYLFQPGKSGNPRGRMSRAERVSRIDAIVAEWASGATLTPAERDLLKHAAGLTLSRKRRTAEDDVRVVNTVRAILRQCGLLGRGRRSPTFADMMKAKNGSR